jgi:hypothetical protein
MRSGWAGLWCRGDVSSITNVPAGTREPASQGHLGVKAMPVKSRMLNALNADCYTVQRKMAWRILPALLSLMILCMAGCGRRSAVNGGSEDGAIQIVEALQGDCRRPSDFVDTYRPHWVDEVEGNPVVEVNLKNNRNVKDATLAQMKALSGLRGLWLAEANVTDVGMKELAPFEHLRELVLFKTNVSDEGLKYLESVSPGRRPG